MLMFWIYFISFRDDMIDQTLIYEHLDRVLILSGRSACMYTI